jgi:hypothetical protein
MSAAAYSAQVYTQLDAGMPVKVSRHQAEAAGGGRRRRRATHATRKIHEELPIDKVELQRRAITAAAPPATLATINTLKRIVFGIGGLALTLALLRSEYDDFDSAVDTVRARASALAQKTRTTGFPLPRTALHQMVRWTWPTKGTRMSCGPPALARR